LTAEALAEVVLAFCKTPAVNDSMTWVRTRGFAPFAVYRILAGAAVLWWAR